MSEKICIIGAGSSGIAAAKVLKDHQLPFDCFEKGSQIGGNWRYMNDNGQSSAYASLHINTSKKKMAFSDFPMPNEIPHYPHHTHIAKYFDDYAEHFGIRASIIFNTEVVSVRNDPQSNRWLVKLNNGETREYRAVLVANGHHWHPKSPVYDGRFSGSIIHSHDYKTPDAYRNLRVLVVGIGNSGVDIACELSHLAQKVFLSSRRSAHILPKYIFGKPIDHFTTPAGSLVPLTIQRMGFNLLLWLARGSQESYGMPKPDHALLQEHPTVSSDLLVRVGHGDIIIKPNADELCDDSVRFTDGSMEKIDAIIYSTGYQVTFPFLNNGIEVVEDNWTALYHRVIPPAYPGLYFIGLLQPLGAIMPLAELQSIWVARILTGKCGLPEQAEMEHEIEREKKRIQKRYIDSPRHTMQVDFYRYRRAVKKAMKRKPD